MVDAHFNILGALLATAAATKHLWVTSFPERLVWRSPDPHFTSAKIVTPVAHKDNPSFWSCLWRRPTILAVTLLVDVIILNALLTKSIWYRSCGGDLFTIDPVAPFSCIVSVFWTQEAH